MSAVVGLDAGVRLRRAEDRWLEQSADRLRRAARGHRARPSADEPPAPPVAHEGATS